jgi:hypothetical protein
MLVERLEEARMPLVDDGDGGVEALDVAVWGECTVFVVMPLLTVLVVVIVTATGGCTGWGS